MGLRLGLRIIQGPAAERRSGPRPRLRFWVSESASGWTGLPLFVLDGYDAFLGFLLIAAAVPVLALVTNKLVAPKSRTGERDLTYESGMEPIGGAWIQFNIRPIK